MLRDEPLVIVTAIIFIIPVAIFVPALLGVSTNDMSDRSEIIAENESIEVSGEFNLSVEEIGTNSANISLRDSERGDYDLREIQEGQNVTYEFSDGDIIVENEEIHSDINSVFLSIEYPSDYGKEESEKQVNTSIPYVVVIPIFLVVGGVFFSLMIGGKQ